jgi:hypothetical protein
MSIRAVNSEIFLTCLRYVMSCSLCLPLHLESSLIRHCGVHFVVNLRCNRMVTKLAHLTRVTQNSQIYACLCC